MTKKERQLTAALHAITSWVLHGDRTGNPYLKPPVRVAIGTLNGLCSIDEDLNLEPLMSLMHGSCTVSRRGIDPCSFASIREAAAWLAGRPNPCLHTAVRVRAGLIEADIVDLKEGTAAAIARQIKQIITHRNNL